MRILTGTLKGRSIPFKQQPGLRPTPDKVRKAIIDTLADFQDKRVLDLFSGTGALGMEMLSAGSNVEFVEQSPTLCQSIEEWIEKAGQGSHVVVSCEDVFTCIKTSSRDTTLGVHNRD